VSLLEAWSRSRSRPAMAVELVLGEEEVVVAAAEAAAVVAEAVVVVAAAAAASWGDVAVWSACGLKQRRDH
jgi:hypothetical protein